jgi:hypothetical protein
MGGLFHNTRNANRFRAQKQRINVWLRTHTIAIPKQAPRSNVLQQGIELNLLLGRFLFALRFRRVKDCHRRLKQAMQRHFELWELFDRLMQAQHREQYKNLP